MKKHPKRPTLLSVAVLAMAALVAGCSGGGGGNVDDDAPVDPDSTWDEMNWDEGEWV